MSIEQIPLSYGVLRQRQLTDVIDGHIEDLTVCGYAVVDSGLDAARLGDLRERLAQLQAAQGAGGLEEDHGVIRCPLSRDETLLEVATLPTVLEIARRSFGPNFVLLQQNAILNAPTSPHYQSRWHRDLPYQHFTSSHRLAISALVCLNDFTAETGGTVVLPGSHLLPEFPSARFVAREERGVEAPAGSVILMDAMLYHRAGANRSGALRIGVNHLIGLPMLVQQIDIPRLLGPRFATDPFLGPYLGYHWNPAPDVGAWRSRRS